MFGDYFNKSSIAACISVLLAVCALKVATSQVSTGTFVAMCITSIVCYIAAWLFNS